MAEEEPREDPEEKEGSNPNEKRIVSNGESRYSRVDNSIEDYLRRKEERRTKSSDVGHSKRTGLARSQTPLKRTPLNKVSKKQKKRNADYKKAREIHYSEESNRKCYLCGTTDNLSIHHKEKRGVNTANESTFITLCLIGNYMDMQHPESNHSHQGGCHSWLEANKSWARENGLL